MNEMTISKWQMASIGRSSSSSSFSRANLAALRADNDQSRMTARLARFAVQALMEEAELTPKPALIDRRGPGAHADFSLALMRRSANCLGPWFEPIALASLQQVPTQTLREELGIGRWADESMLLSTGGVNTHQCIIMTGHCRRARS